jgi:hypothetical protein
MRRKEALFPMSVHSGFTFIQSLPSWSIGALRPKQILKEI